MSTNEKSLKVIENKGIFAKITNLLKTLFSGNKNYESFPVNETIEDNNKNNFFTKFNNQTPNTKTKLLEIQEKLERNGINKKNAIELTKDLTDAEKKELFNLYEEQIKNYEKNIDYCKNKILAIKKKM